MQLPGSQRERAADARLHMPDLAKHASALESLQEMMPQLVALQRIDYRQTHRVWRCRFIFNDYVIIDFVVGGPIF